MATEFGEGMIKPKVHIAVDFVDGPWGGGNQFLKALYKSLQKRGIEVSTDSDFDAEVVLINSFNSKSIDRIDNWKKDGKKIVHRIDGPIQLVRGKDKEKDDFIFEINKKADWTIFQSRWSCKENKRLGWRGSNHCVILNGTDLDIFTPKLRQDPTSIRSTKVIGSSWSTNPKKGLQFWIDLDTDLGWRQMMGQSVPIVTFVGRVDYHFRNIKHVKAVSSKELADLYDQHHVYVHPTIDEPCSNALIEAQACGLPTIVNDSGSNSEVLGRGGVAVKSLDPTLFFAALGRVLEQYQRFVRNVEIRNIDNVCSQYLAVFEEVLNG